MVLNYFYMLLTRALYAARHVPPRRPPPCRRRNTHRAFISMDFGAERHSSNERIGHEMVKLTFGLFN